MLLLRDIVDISNHAIRGGDDRFPGVSLLIFVLILVDKERNGVTKYPRNWFGIVWGRRIRCEAGAQVLGLGRGHRHAQARRVFRPLNGQIGDDRLGGQPGNDVTLMVDLVG